MSIFLFAAIGMFLLWPLAEKVIKRSGKWAPGLLAPFGILAMASAILVFCHQIQTPPPDGLGKILKQAAQAEGQWLVLGTIFGVFLSRWIETLVNAGKHPIDLRSLIARGAILMILLAMADLASDAGAARTMIKSLGSVKAAGIEFNFGVTNPAQQLVFQAQRQGQMRTSLAVFRTYHDLVKQDANTEYVRYVLAEAKVAGKRPAPDALERKKHYDTVQKIIENTLSPVFRCGTRAENEHVAADRIRSELNPVMDAVHQISTSKSIHAKAENKVSEAILHKTLVASAENARKHLSKLLQDITECAEGTEYKLEEIELKGLSEGPHWTVLEARLLIYMGDQNSALRVLEDWDAATTYADQNVKANLAHLYYYSGDQQRSLSYIEQALALVMAANREMAAASEQHCKSVRSEIPNCWEQVKDVLPKLKSRYDGLVRRYKNDFAQFAADAGIHQETALNFVEENSKAEPTDWIYKDTYAYVRMAVAARSNPPKFEWIEDSWRRFGEAEVEARLESRAIDKKNPTARLQLDRLEMSLAVLRAHREYAASLLKSRPNH